MLNAILKHSLALRNVINTLKHVLRTFYGIVSAYDSPPLNNHCDFLTNIKKEQDKCSFLKGKMIVRGSPLALWGQGD
ncbi:hypothetical protein DFP75_10332 [Marinomonas alcarazii]|uniref:Uncharacterized protein n=1 Tax=Marinomonas alcarazii TaxID=491949 RepID=A0A318UZX4_9GAMM|nr:hypothetical protein DFP75_10332 [Marinomonas alcarazii]